MATFCFCPPESEEITRSRKSEMPMSASACATRPSIWSRGTAKFSRP